jgi:hypothetical protein
MKILRAKTSKLAKEFASQANNATSAQEAKELLEQGMKELQTMYEETVRKFLFLLLDFLTFAVLAHFRRVNLLSLTTAVLAGGLSLRVHTRSQLHHYHTDTFALARFARLNCFRV